jgi:hypothetical protein
LHCESLVQAATQVPATQNGSADVQSAFDLHAAVALGWHVPLVHVSPAGHVDDVVQPGTHCPLSQRSPAAHWFEYLQTAALGWHAPATHWSPFEQSVVLVQGHGPFVPPQVMQAFW